MGIIILFLLAIILGVDIVLFRAASMYDREEEEEMSEHDKT